MISADNVKRCSTALIRYLGVVLIGAACAVSSARAELPAVQQYGGVDYVTGGFGSDESAAMKAAMPDYPLVFTFAASDGSRSAYVSRVQVVVRDQYNATVLNVETQGPFLLARVGPGTYQVHATYRNQTQSRQVSVSEGKSTRLVFEWQRSMDEGAVPEPAADRPDSESGSTFEFAPGSIPGLD